MQSTETPFQSRQRIPDSRFARPPSKLVRHGCVRGCALEPSARQALLPTTMKLTSLRSALRSTTSRSFPSALRANWPVAASPAKKMMFTCLFHNPVVSLICYKSGAPALHDAERAPSTVHRLRRRHRPRAASSSSPSGPFVRVVHAKLDSVHNSFMASRFGLSALVSRRLLQHQGCAQVACRGYAAENNKLAAKNTASYLSDTSSKDWKRVKDKQTGQHYWWNKTTGTSAATRADCQQLG
jgi:hypothetical protein